MKKLRTWLGRVIRDVRRKVPQPSAALEKLLPLCKRLHAQKPTDKRKLYSLHEPDVMCISKGKAHQRYEFGREVSVTTSNRGNWITGVDLCQASPYDGHTLAQASTTTESTTGVVVTSVYADKGYRVHDYQGDAAIHISGSSPRGLTRTQKRCRNRRSAIDTKIGHLKSDCRMSRCFLKGLTGDAINLVLAAVGSNLRKLLDAIASAPLWSTWCRLAQRHNRTQPRLLTVQRGQHSTHIFRTRSGAFFRDDYLRSLLQRCKRCTEKSRAIRKNSSGTSAPGPPGGVGKNPADGRNATAGTGVSSDRDGAASRENSLATGFRISNLVPTPVDGEWLCDIRRSGSSALRDVAMS